MPFLGREKDRSPRSRRSDDEFVVFLQGIPAHCRWQELKDLVRQTALHIRQAVVYDDSHGFPTGLGQIIVKNEDEAWRTYHRLSTSGWEGQSLVVTLARTCAPTKPIAGPTRSPPAMMQGYMSGHSTPPRSQGNMAMPPSPISPESAHSSPTCPYPEYGPTMGPMPMPPQQFMSIMPDPLQHMHCFPPSPLMSCSVYDTPGWNMMPLYPISPIQPLHEPRDNYPRYHPRKPWTNTNDKNSSSRTPSHDSTQRAVYIKNQNSTNTTADLKPLRQGAGSVEQCNVTVTSDAHDTQAQTHASATMHSRDGSKRAPTMLDHMMLMGSRNQVETDQRPGVIRSGSWDGAVAALDDVGLGDSVRSEKGSGRSECGQDGPGTKTVQPNRPLVVDGSGLQRRSLEMLSTSAPT